MCYVLLFYVEKKTNLQHSTDVFIDMRKAFFIHVQKRKKTVSHAKLAESIMWISFEFVSISKQKWFW